MSHSLTIYPFQPQGGELIWTGSQCSGLGHIPSFLQSKDTLLHQSVSLGVIAHRAHPDVFCGAPSRTARRGAAMARAGAHSERPADVVILVAGLLVRLRRTRKASENHEKP